MNNSAFGNRGDGRRRAVILGVRPEVAGGRWPVKRALGEALRVEADIVTDGHDHLRAALLHRRKGETEFHEIPLTAGPNDLFTATFTPDKLGRHVYTVEAWIDTFATWRHGFSRKRAAGQDLSVELLAGASLVAAAAARAEARGAKEDAAWLGVVATELGSVAPAEVRADRAENAELEARMARHPDRSLVTRYLKDLEVTVDRPLARTGAWYELFPRSCGPEGQHGTLKDVEERLSYVAELGFDVLYLPPIHPIGEAFRKGPNNSPHAGPGDPGSPWAIGSEAGGHTAVHPELGTVDDLAHLAARARTLGIEIAMDIAFQASPDHPWVKEHPGWFRKRADGTIQYAENPPKKYQDVYPFDFECDDWKALWEALRGVFLFWIDKGVKVFRVDNPHTKPIAFWEWAIRTIQEQHPDTVFLAEAFTRPKLMLSLAQAGFSQSYTYFTWRTTGAELTAYLTDLMRPEVANVFRPNFWPTTPDIFPEHLQHATRAAFTIRLILAATLSPSYGIYGPSYELMEKVPRHDAEELKDNEKYQIRKWNLDHPDSLRHVIAQVNRIRKANPAIKSFGSLRFHKTDNDLVLCYSRSSEDEKNLLLVVVNLDPRHTHSAWIDLDLEALGIAPDRPIQAHDLLGGDRYSWLGSRAYVELSPQLMPAHIFSIRRFVRTENMFEYFL
ncbi:MAG: alpha-1,4-glucan--maltose-1-phosphate maltosyltransferase [Polyangiaceae bacterium]